MKNIEESVIDNFQRCKRSMWPSSRMIKETTIKETKIKDKF